MQAAIMTGEVSLLKTCLNVAVAARSHKEEQTGATKEELLADTINELIDTEEIDLNQLLRLIDKGRL